MHLFNSDVFAAKERVEAWEDFAGKNFAHVHVSSVEGEFIARADGNAVGQLSMLQLQGSGYESGRGAYEIARQRNHFYSFVVHLDSDVKLQTRHGIQHVMPGDVTLLSTMHNFTAGMQHPFRHIVVKLPQHWPEFHALRPDLLCGTVIPREHPLRFIFADYVSSIFRRSHELSLTAAGIVSRHVLDLALEMLSTNEINKSLSTACRAAIFDRACREIERRHNDPSLRPEHIARGLGISLRMLQRVMAGQGDTVMQRVSEVRIDHAAAMLLSLEGRPRTITEVAFSCGFRDLTTFGRMFVANKGATPSEWRRSALGIGCVSQRTSLELANVPRTST
jgi:AraC family transcriptional regulator, positive regulator of tynA and feaB